MDKSAWWYVAAVAWVVGILSGISAIAGGPWWALPAVVGIGCGMAAVIGIPLLWFLKKAIGDDR